MKLADACSYCGPQCEVGYGYCHCGCGRQTKSATSTYTTAGGHRVVKGFPSMYCIGHRAKRYCITSNSALNSSFARIIRAMYVHDEVPQKDIAKAFGVSPAAICKIVMFDSYKNAGIATKKELEDYYSSFTDN